MASQQKPRRRSVSSMVAGVLFLGFSLHPLVWNHIFPKLPSGISVLFLLIWLAVPLYVIVFAEALAGKITFIVGHGPQNEPGWAVRALGWIMFGIQFAALFIPQVARWINDLG